MLVHCDECAGTVDAQVEGTHVTRESETAFRRRYELLVCPRCESPFLYESRESLHSLSAHNAWEIDWQDPSRLFPVATQTKTEKFPATVRRAYEEAARCRAAKAFTATALLCRKTIEAVCAAHEVGGKNLAESLELMRSQGIIERRLYEWADELRIGRQRGCS